MSKRFLEELAHPFKGVGRDIDIRIDGADLNLVAEALDCGCEFNSYDDCQVIGRFYHYRIKIGNVRFELITTKQVRKDEAKRARYLGMTIEQYRKAFPAPQKYSWEQ